MRTAILGLHQPGSGLTKVADHLSYHLTQKGEVVRYGFDPKASHVHVARHDRECVTVMPCRNGRFHMPDETMTDMMAGRPDAIVAIGPAYLMEGMLARLDGRPGRKDVNVVLYLPTEGKIVSPLILEAIAPADHCVVYTPSALSDLRSLYGSAEAERIGMLPMLHAVGHGVDLVTFHERPERHDRALRHEARRSFWNADDADEICLLSVARPYGRKRLDLAIAGFSLHARRREGTRLVLHCGEATNEIRQWIRQSGVPDRISVIEDGMLTDERLNLLYNTCEIGLSTSMGEGWGLPAFEHAATGAAQIVPDHTSFRDNWSGAATMIPSPDARRMFFEYSTMHAPTIEGVRDGIESTLIDLLDLAGRSQARSRNQRYHWSAVGQAFSEITMQGPAI